MPAASPTILVVDDDSAIRDVIIRMLSEKGFGVLSVSTGTEALRILAERPVDLLFADIVTPGMDGVELTRKARQLRPGLKVLLSSGYAQKATEKGAIRQARILYKPFRQDELMREIEALLGP